MTIIRRLAVIVALCAPVPAFAQEAIVTPYDGAFDDAVFGLETAIIERGLKVDHISHVGEMLARTGADLGLTTEIFKRADIYLFCSATLSREMMEADPFNIVHCPYSVGVAETGEGVFFTYRSYPDGPMQKVQAELAGIVEDAAGF